MSNSAPFLHRLKARLARFFQRLSVKLGGAHAYYDGVPASIELDKIVNYMDEMGIPREQRDWPLLPSDRFRTFVRDAPAKLSVV